MTEARTPSPAMIPRKSRMMRTELILFRRIARYISGPLPDRAPGRARACAFLPGSELHPRRLGDRRGVGDLEELALGEAEAAREDVVREDLDLRVELADAAVVEAAGGLDLVLGRDELALELEEV